MKRQNEYIFCEENRYWVAVLGGGVSSVLIILLLLYFAASYYRRIDNYQVGFENKKGPFWPISFCKPIKALFF